MPSSAESATAQLGGPTSAVRPRRWSWRTERIAGMWHWLLALIDQAFVSGTRFLATIIVGRFCGPTELGSYSLAFSVLILAGCLQEAVITTPYAALGHRLRKRSRNTYAGAVARLHVLVLAASAAILVALALIGTVFELPALASIAGVLAITLPCSLAAEFARRFALAELDVRWATCLDAAAAAIQVVLMLVLIQVRWLDARTALLAVGVAYALPAIVWWCVYAKTRMRSGGSLALYWPRNWKLGRWLVASQVMGVIHGFMPAWLLAVLVGREATGEFVAYFNLAMLVNPIIFAIGNLLTPQAAKTLARSGREAAQRLVLRVLFYLLALMTLFALALGVAGHTFVQFIYGRSFISSESTAVVLGLIAITWAITTACASGLVAFGRPRWSFVASCAGSIVTAIAIAILAPIWSVFGATLGIFLGSIAAAAVHGWAFVQISGGLRSRQKSTTHTYDHRLAIQDCTNA